MNPFDAAVVALVVAALVIGFNSGLLRSLATILAYVSALPIAVAATPFVSTMPLDKATPPGVQNALVFFAIFLATAALLGALLRLAVSETIGPRISLPDRLLGALFGAARIGLVAVTVVVIFDQLIPPDRQPVFLNGSRLRPILSVAGQMGLKSLPPDVATFVDQLKADRRV
jgi:membrane protein required for colicin V production